MINRLPRRVRAAMLSVLTVGAIGVTTVVVSSPAQAATRCVVNKGFSVASGGCDNDGHYDTRLHIRCRVVGSYFEYERETVWHSRYTSWQGWVGCGDQGRVRAAWIDWRH